jgi:phage host-nuclease inhibitor protein Gam
VPALLKCFEDKLQEKNVQKGERQSFLSPQFERLARAQEEEIRRLQQQLCDLLKLPDDSEAPELNALKKEIETLNDTAQYLTQQRELEEEELTKSLERLVHELETLEEERNDLTLLLRDEEEQVVKLRERLAQLEQT